MNTKREPGRAGEQSRCPGCGAEADAGDRFCRNCGRSFSESRVTRRPLRGPIGLWGLGLLVVSMATLFAFLRYGGRDFHDAAPPGERIPIGDVGAVGDRTLAPPTPREFADGLFNRAMAAFEAGDSTASRRLVPLALDAYRDLEHVDIDARYHVALLQIAANRPAAALAQADTMLAAVSDHLLGLAVAARAQHLLGHPERAAGLYQRFLDAYDAESATARPEYLDHKAVLPAQEERARRYLRDR